MDQPVITTKRLLLRAFRQNDAGEVQRLAGNPLVSGPTRNIPSPYCDGMAEAWISSLESHWKNKSGITFAAEIMVSQQLIGAVSLVEIKDVNATLGYWIGVPYWGKGYCTEAAAALLNYAFSKQGITRVVAEHLCSNPASGRVMEKIGMQCLKRIHSPDRHGCLLPVDVYSIIRQKK